MKSTKTMQYRRKREGRTDYKKRLKLLVSGAPRLVVRRTNKSILAQVIDYQDQGDKVHVTVSGSDLKKLGWKHSTSNIPAAYLIGMLAAKKASDKKIKSAIIDLGLQSPLSGSKVYATVKGAIDFGMEIPSSPDVFPSADRLSGKHIAAYGKISKQFKNSPDNIEKDFNDLKQKLTK